MIGDNDPSRKLLLNNNEIATFNKEELLGILSDKKLSFDSHIKTLCKSASQKRSACKNKSLPHFRLENFATKLSSKIPIQLLPTDMDVYFSRFKQCIKQHSQTNLPFYLQ